MSQRFDIIAVGGGPAGALAALALAARGFSCAVVDADDPAVMRGAAFDGRTSALSYATVRVFRRLGLWGQIAPEAEPIRQILVTDGRPRSQLSSGFVSGLQMHFDAHELGPGADGEDQPLGWIVENRVIRDALFDAIETEPRITLFAPATRMASAFGPAAAQVTLADGRVLEAALVLAADGRYSRLRDEVGIKTNQWSYNQTGIVITVAHERPHQGVAHEFFLPSGPFAILPMTPVREGGQNTPVCEGGQIKKYRSSLVWTERAAAAPAYTALDDDKFRIEIENRFGDHLGAVTPAGPRWSYPLAFRLAQSFIAPRLALVGDAAHGIHPIAGQGYNLGIKDVAVLADVLPEGRDLGLDIGSLNVLENYQRWRRFDSAAMALGCDSFVRLFSNDIGPLRLARDLGMAAVAKVKPLRQFFMRQAGADVGDLPSLMAREP